MPNGARRKGPAARLAAEHLVGDRAEVALFPAVGVDDGVGLPDAEPPGAARPGFVAGDDLAPHAYGRLAKGDRLLHALLGETEA